MATFAEIIGVIGAFLILFMYFLLEAKKIRSDKPLYPTLNLLGALMVILSLVYSWNLAAFIIQGAWVLISVYGLYCAYQKHKKS